jgi:DNA-directed RNA polymerase subunit RPC12/RpoP
MKYKCMKCGTVFDPSGIVKCPKCGASGILDIKPEIEHIARK